MDRTRIEAEALAEHRSVFGEYKNYTPPRYEDYSNEAIHIPMSEGHRIALDVDAARAAAARGEAPDHPLHDEVLAREEGLPGRRAGPLLHEPRLRIRPGGRARHRRLLRHLAEHVAPGPPSPTTGRRSTGSSPSRGPTGRSGAPASRTPAPRPNCSPLPITRPSRRWPRSSSSSTSTRTSSIPAGCFLISLWRGTSKDAGCST